MPANKKLARPARRRHRARGDARSAARHRLDGPQGGRVTLRPRRGPGRRRRDRSARHADRRRDRCPRQGGRRGAVRRGGRAEMGRAGLRPPPGTGHPDAAPRAGAVRQSAPGGGDRRAGRRQHAQARGGAGPRPHDRAREHRRHLFRRAARHRDAARRQQARGEHRGLYHRGNRARGAGRLRAGEAPAGAGVQRREGQRDGERAAVAADRDQRWAPRNFPRCSFRTCTPTTAPCSWCAIRASSMSS